MFKYSFIKRRFQEEEPGTGDGGTGDTWLSGLPEELQGNATLQDVKSVESLAKQFIDTKAMVGASVRVPGEDAPDEDMVAFRQTLIDKNIGLMAVPNTEDPEAMAGIYRAMGLPEDSSGYTKPDEWAGMTPERFETLAARAHELGMSKSQFNDMAAGLAKDSNTLMQAANDAHSTEMNELRVEWGAATDQKIARATNIAEQLEAPERLLAAMKAGDVDAQTIRWFDNIAAKFSGEGTSLVLDKGGVNADTPAELRERVDEITNKMLKMNVGDPQYQPLLQKRLKYLEILNPEKK